MSESSLVRQADTTNRQDEMSQLTELVALSTSEDPDLTGRQAGVGLCLRNSGRLLILIFHRYRSADLLRLFYDLILSSLLILTPKLHHDLESNSPRNTHSPNL